MPKVFIIAEAGVNHNGSLAIAKKLVDAAVEARVDAVKFQTWKTELMVTHKAEQAAYQIQNTKFIESQFNMLKKLELTYPDFIELKKYCDVKNIMFLSTPDEIQSAQFLRDLQDIFKIGSGNLTNFPLLQFIGTMSKSIIISTGMANLEEIRTAIKVLEEAGTSRNNITILHCTTEYPAPINEINLLAMKTIQNTFNLPVGYSDHSLGIEIPIAAVALGATVIEKHFTLSRDLQGPDHKASLEPIELQRMVDSIRKIEFALGDGIKRLMPSEIGNSLIARKSIVANQIIKKGDKFSKNNIAVKRPGSGISPMRWNEIIGTYAQKDYFEEDLIIDG